MTGSVLDVFNVVVTEIVFAALSPDAHVKDAGLNAIPGTAVGRTVGVTVMFFPVEGELLGFTDTVWAGPPLTTLTPFNAHVATKLNAA